MNFDDISKKLREFGQNTVDEVQKLNEVRRLNSGISSEKKKINSVYTEIGRKLYNLYKSEPLSGFEAEIGTLKASFRKIDSLQDQIRTVKGVQLCPHCKSEVGISERFCPNCGSRLPEAYTIEEAEVLEHTESEDFGSPEEVFPEGSEAETAEYTKPEDFGHPEETIPEGSEAETAEHTEPEDFGSPEETFPEGSEAEKEP